MENSINYDKDFWEYLNKLVKKNEIIIDRPKGTRHPKYCNIIYDLDYGYINGTKAIDGNGIDVFKGSLHNKNVNTIMCTIDLLKKDIEIKILIGCTVSEIDKVYSFLNKSEYMKAIIIEKDVNIKNVQKEIYRLPMDYDFEDVFEVFEDIVYNPSKENITDILLKFKKDNEKILYGYFLDKKLIGIIGIMKNVGNNEILHFGIHPEYRGKNLGTELMDYIKNMNKTMILSTDDDAIIFYEKYGFKYTKYFNEKYNQIRYNCIYEQ
jgi:inorganic pyrophosphatase